TVGSVYIIGRTSSANLPLVNATQPYRGDQDVFVTKLNPAGSAIVYSTYIGGSSYDTAVKGIAVDSAGNAYIVGGTDSTDFPAVNPLQPASAGGADAFIAKLNAAGSALIFSTYLGGSLSEFAAGIVLDQFGNVYIAGHTSSSNFPTSFSLQP